MSKQLGACAFSNACINPGPRERLAGTNRYFCHSHMQVVASVVATPQSSNGPEQSARITVRSRRGSWPLMIGAAQGV